MTVHVVIPVFNRLAMTQRLVACLRQQQAAEPLRMLVVDDGSSDGTDNWLRQQADITVLRGDGNLFWGGAVDLAVRHLTLEAAAHDWLLLMNNDTTVDTGFVQELVDTARAHQPAAVGSVIRSETAPHALLSLGANVDPWRLVTRELLDDEAQSSPRSLFDVDVLSGRGVLFPLASVVAAGGMRPRTLPHYLADYELSLRVRRAGWRLLVATTAAVYSADEYGSTRRGVTWREKFLSVRSPAYLPAVVQFWWQASTKLQRVSLPLRVALFMVFPQLRKNA